MAVKRRRRAAEPEGPWHNPRLLNGIANALFGVAAVLSLWLAWQAATRSSAFPLHLLVVNGELHSVDHDDLAAALSRGVPGNFFGADLTALQARLEQVPWVRRAEVRRLWPDRLSARIEEHIPFARWGVGALVNTHGEVFEARTSAPLPLFAGPPGTSLEVALRYAEFRERLAPVGLELTHVTLSPRYAWQIKVNTAASRGLTLELGRDLLKDPLVARLGRFVEAYPRTLARLDRRLDYVDLRYPNGFALRAPDLVGDDAHRAPGRRVEG